MKRTLLAVLLVLVATSFASGTFEMHWTTGTSMWMSIWQTIPEIFAPTTYWGGIGLEFGLGVVNVNLMVTITDFQSFTITTDPSFEVEFTRKILQLGPVQTDIEVGFMITPSIDFMTIDTGIMFDYEVLTNTKLHLAFGAQTTLPWIAHSGSTLNVGIGVTHQVSILDLIQSIISTDNAGG